jgi:hypothetical protein
MKKIGILILIILSILFLFGCTQEPVNSQPANNRLSINACESLGYYEKIECIRNLALENSNYAICDEIDAKSFVVECYKLVAVKIKDKTICGKLSLPDDITFCYWGMACELKDPTLCETQIPDVPSYAESRRQCFECAN